jgi:hypothetical protein
MTMTKENIRRALGLSDGATDDEIILKLAERVGIKPAPQTVRYSMPIDPSAVQASSTMTLSEGAQLVETFKKITQPDPNGFSLSELDQMDATFAKYPHLYEQYRRTVTQAS